MLPRPTHASNFLGKIGCLLFIAGSIGCETNAHSPTPKKPAPAPGAKSSPATSNLPAAPTQRKEVAGVGATGKGNYSGGMVTTPVGQYFKIKEKLVFEFAIPQAMNLFKASEGRAPKDQKEFMQRIVAENAIKLPKLPEGHEYLYDPADETLYVTSPAEAENK